MKAYGHIVKEIDRTGLCELKDVSFKASPNVLRSMAALFLKGADLMDKNGKKFEGLHLKDSWKQWRDDYPDVIIVNEEDS